MNRTNLVFLDIDGVINGQVWFDSEEYKTRRASSQLREMSLRSGDHTDDEYRILLKTTHIDPKALAILNTILVENDLDIVLSSTWRIAEFTRQALEECGIDNWNDRFRGVTPRSKHGRTRGHEIQEWLDKSGFKGRFAILDDDPDMAHLMPHLIQTSWMDGLTTDHVEKFRKFFQS